MTAWEVRLGGETIDTVFFDSDVSADEVRRSLIDHDGYDPGITVSMESPEMPAPGYDAQTRSLELVEEERRAIEQLVWGRLMTAQSNADKHELDWYRQAERREASMLGRLLERIRAL